MLKFLSAVVTFFLTVVTRIFKKRDENKTAEEALSETPNIDAIRAEADRRAEEKFGPPKA